MIDNKKRYYLFYSSNKNKLRNIFWVLPWFFFLFFVNKNNHWLWSTIWYIEDRLLSNVRSRVRIKYVKCRYCYHH